MNLAKVATARMAMLLHDLGSVVRHGSNGPRHGELIWLDPSTISRATSGLDRSATGKVLGGAWDRDVVAIDSIWKIAAARMHWQEGVPWEETGVYDLMLAEISRSGRSLDGCRTLDDVVRRYERLDDLFERVRQERRLQPVRERSRFMRREVGGVYVHVARDGEPLFGRGGCHRLVMAQVLELPDMPAQLGAVHLEAVATWRSLYAA